MENPRLVKKTLKQPKLLSKSLLTVKLLRKLIVLSYFMMDWLKQLSLIPLPILILPLWYILC